MEGGISQKEKYRYVAHLMFLLDVHCFHLEFGLSPALLLQAEQQDHFLSKLKGT